GGPGPRTPPRTREEVRSRGRAEGEHQHPTAEAWWHGGPPRDGTSPPIFEVLATAAIFPFHDDPRFAPAHARVRKHSPEPGRGRTPDRTKLVTRGVLAPVASSSAHAHPHRSSAVRREI